jgi:purine-cytosine permease-like protein
VSSTTGTLVGYAAGNAWFFALGAVLVLGAGSTPTPQGIGEGIITLAGGTLVLIVLLVGETDEAFADIYSAAVSSQNLFPRLRLRTAVIAVAAVGVGLAAYLFGLADEGVATFEFFLFLIGSIFVPLFGVFLAHYYLVDRGGYRTESLFDHRGRYRFTGGFNLAAAASWLLGFAVYHWIAPTPLEGWSGAVETLYADWLGLPFPLFGGEVPASIVAFAVAFAAAALLGLSRSRRGGAEAAPPPSG